MFPAPLLLFGEPKREPKVPSIASRQKTSSSENLRFSEPFPK